MNSAGRKRRRGSLAVLNRFSVLDITHLPTLQQTTAYSRYGELVKNQKKSTKTHLTTHDPVAVNMKESFALRNGQKAI